MGASVTKLRRKAVLLLLCLLVPAMLMACASEGASPVGSGEASLSPSPSPAAASSEPKTDVSETPVPDFESSSLAEAYADYFLIGTVYNPTSTSGKDKELLLKDFNVITPENLMKPQYMQPTEGEFAFSSSDTMVKFAQENGLKVVGHTLAWHQQSGNWLGINVSRDEAIEQLRSHITTIVGKYKGQVMSWDVVNEAINDSVSLPSNGDWTKCLRNTQWLQSIGPDYIALAFQFAHEADPDAKLYYNDYNLNVSQKAQIVHAMVKDLLAQGVPIHGIGMQGHYKSNMQIGPVEESIKLFSELDVEISITELDVTVSGATAAGLTEDQERAQAVTYAKLFKLFKKYSDKIARVTFWGTLDSRSWRAKMFPCLFNSDYTPKEAYYAVLDPEGYLGEKGGESKVEGNNIRAPYGTPLIDGEIDDIWQISPEVRIENQLTAWEGATGKVRILWDEGYVYALFEVKDSVLNKQSSNAYEQDSVELFLDQNNDRTPAYGPDDGQYRVNFDGETSFGSIPDLQGFVSAANKTADGYLVEMAIPLLKTAKPGTIMGIDAQINDSNAQGIRQGIATLYDQSGDSWQSLINAGKLILVKE